jgi:hypothetical protein
MMSGIASIYQTRRDKEYARAKAEGCSDEEARRRANAERDRAVGDAHRDAANILVGGTKGLFRHGPVGFFTGMFGTVLKNLTKD